MIEHLEHPRSLPDFGTINRCYSLWDSELNLHIPLASEGYHPQLHVVFYHHSESSDFFGGAGGLMSMNLCVMQPLESRSPNAHGT